jgi:hypothetical protein
MTDLAWLVFGLIQADAVEDRSFRILDHCTIVYGLEDRAIAIRFGCPYWIRIEGRNWGMIVSTTSHGIFLRGMRGDKEMAERDLFLLRMVLPIHP